MGSYTFRWYVISAPPSFDSKGQGCELGHGTAARVRAGKQLALVELSTREPSMLLGRAVLPIYATASPRTRKSSHPFTLVIKHNIHTSLFTTRLLTAASST